MGKSIRILLAFGSLGIAVLACGLFPGRADSPSVSPEAVSTAVALTFQALTPTASPATETPDPGPGLLPRALYYLAADSAGLTQVFRLDKDGQTREQITTEPVSASDYGVSPVDGSVAYVVNNQLVMVDAGGSGRRILVDGGAVDENNPFVNRVSHPVFSPDGKTLAYGHQGLNFYDLSTGVSSRAIENQFDDMGNGVFFPKELYFPENYSPNGSRLLVTLGYWEGASSAFFDPASQSLVRLKDEAGTMICCDQTQWSADGSSVHAANPAMGMFSAGLWETDPATGQVTTLLASDWPTSMINHARDPYLAPDGQLYYFFHTSNNPDLSRIPLQIVRSAPDGVTGRTVVREGTFEMMNEGLWAPDASFVIVTSATSDTMYQGGQAEIVYLDGHPNVVLAPFAQDMKWGP